MIQYSELREIVRINRERFKQDPRYSSSAIAAGLACRNSTDEDDSALLHRICEAYIKATERERSAPSVFGPTKWWAGIRNTHLTPVIQALRTRDIDSLRCMYRNFFRDPCSTGLLGLPVDMQRCYFNGEVEMLHEHFFLADALHRQDLWRLLTNGNVPTSALASPHIGNPYGVSFDGVFIRNGAEFQHFYAHEISQLLGRKQSTTVLEIGGGFCGMAYYLIRDNPTVTYVNFDVPETIALASYYLLKAFPDIAVTLYGEAELDSALTSGSRLLLMPSCELASLPDLSADISFSSYVLGDLSPESAVEYVRQVERVTRTHVLFLDRITGREPRPISLLQKSKKFVLARKRNTFWDSAIALTTNQAEWLYALRSTPRIKATTPDCTP